MKSGSWVLLLLLLSSWPGQAEAGSVFGGFQLGVGTLTMTDGFYKFAGNGLTQTREGLEPNTGVVRDANNRMGAWTVGFEAGYELPQWFGMFQLGADTRMRYVINAGGGGQHYFRGNPAIIGSEDADFDYYGGSIDVGARACVSDVCLRPFIGFLTSGVQKFNFGPGNDFHLSADENRRLLKGAQVILRGGADHARGELGLEYFWYESHLGGNTSGVLFTVSIFVSSGEKRK